MPLPTAELALLTISLSPAVAGDLRFIGALALVTLIPVWLDRRLRRRSDTRRR